MDGFGSISAFPARQILAVTGIQAKGLDRLVNDPGAALRQLGEQSLTARADDANHSQRPAPIATASDRSLSGALVRSAIDAARGGAEQPAAAQKPEQTPAPEANATQASAANAEANADVEAAEGLEKARVNFADQTKAASEDATVGHDEERGFGELSAEEEKAVQELKARDREVRAHEQAHKNTAGRHGGAISFSFQKGPDGQQYAVGGSVPIDMSAEASPEATIAKMRIVAAAALAPADPSGPDRAIAQAAQAQIIQATADARAERQAEADELRQGDETDEAGARLELSEADEPRPDASAVAGKLAIGALDSPYKVIGVVDFNALGERHEKSMTA